MIRRRDDPKMFITQTAHSWLAGQFALRWSNAQFKAPPLYESLKIAAINHDQGWAQWEKAPEIDAQGRPFDFMEMDVATHLHLWNDSIAATATQCSYGAVLVSMHARFLVEAQMARCDEQDEDFYARQRFSVAQRQWEATQLTYLQRNPYFITACQPHNLEANMRLLQIFDWLSLLLGMDELRESVIVDVPAATANQRVELRFRPTGPQAFTLIPWPFNVPRFFATVQARRLSAATFVDNTALQTDWDQAQIIPLTFEVAAVDT